MIRPKVRNPVQVPAYEPTPIVTIDAPHWQLGAPCAQIDPELFFPETGGSTKAAKRICASCPVRAECLQYALDNGELFGVWGGLSEHERRPLKKSRLTEEAA